VFLCYILVTSTPKHARTIFTVPEPVVSPVVSDVGVGDDARLRGRDRIETTPKPAPVSWKSSCRKLILPEPVVSAVVSAEAVKLLCHSQWCQQ